MSNYRQRWKHGYTGTPTSEQFHASADFTLIQTRPSIASRMIRVAQDVRFARNDADRATAIAAMTALVREASESGLMVDVTTNRDTLRSNSWKHCITLHVHKSSEPMDQASRAFINQMSRKEHDAIMLMVRRMFVAEANA